MSLAFEKQTESLMNRGYSRRHIGRIFSAIGAGAAALPFTEFAMAQEAERRMRGGNRGPIDPSIVRISSNENPLGPCKEGIEAITKIAPLGGRYSPRGEQQEFVKTVAEIEGVREDCVAAFAGSSDPLFRSSCAFSSPTRSWTMGDPGYGSGAPQFIGAKTVKVPLAADYSHDVEAMIKADPDAGAYYVCNPNNPSGALTSREKIEYLLANKKKDAVVIVDEAYIHFSDKAQPASDLVAAGKDLIVLRTFSKVYGMAGIRAGFALGRPDLLAKMRPYGGGMLPVTGLACATASMKVKTLVPERRAINKRIRENTFAFLDKRSIKFVPSETNFFMMETYRPGAEVARAFLDRKIMIGRVWPAWPTHVRVTVGTQEEMDKFTAALGQIME
jgi:histidinol-phosphate/aromatic aminotransferase/cobyric acid decarboxylase-like protein